MRSVVACSLVCAALLWVHPAAADVSADRETCFDAYGATDFDADAEKACDSFLKSKGISKRDKYHAMVTLSHIYMADDDYDSAYDEATDAINFDKSSSDAYVTRGYINIDFSEYDEAIDDLSKAIKINPKDTYALTLRGEAYLFSDHADAALTDLNRAIKLNPKERDAYYYRGLSAYDDFDLDTAIDDFTTAIDLEPSSNAYYYRGDSYGLMGEDDKAIDDMTSAIAIKPGFAMAYANRASLYDEVGDRSHALADYDKAIELNPKDDDSVYARGQIYFKSKDYTSAAANFTSVIEINPDYNEAYLFRGQAYAALGRTADAVADLVHAADKLNNANAYVELGLGYVAAGNTAQANDAFDTAIARATDEIGKPNRSVFDFQYYNRGRAYAGKGRYQDAIADFNAAIQEKKTNGAYFVARAAAYRAIGQSDKADADIAEAGRLGADVTASSGASSSLTIDQNEAEDEPADNGPPAKPTSGSGH